MINGDEARVLLSSDSVAVAEAGGTVTYGGGAVGAAAGGGEGDAGGPGHVGVQGLADEPDVHAPELGQAAERERGREEGREGPRTGRRG